MTDEPFAEFAIKTDWSIHDQIDIRCHGRRVVAYGLARLAVRIGDQTRDAERVDRLQLRLGADALIAHVEDGRVVRDEVGGYHREY